MQKRILTILVLLFMAGPVFAQNTSIGFYAGQWQPRSIEHQGTVSLFRGNAQTTPYFSITVTEALTKTFFLKQTLGFWRQKSILAANIQSITLIPITAAIKHRLVQDSFLMPCVSYGAGLLLGIPKSQKNSETSKTSPKAIGIDIFIGTGFDLVLTKAAGFHVEFSYHYAKFSSPVGDTDDFTGPQGVLGFYYQF
ncbi:MAG: hypothetical protein GXO76_04525 [Calditrichaeota bacterium]|nr:hypothetical protein [Calditrichota bacterium]